MAINKAKRQEVYKKCDGRCAYCGTEITYKQMQVDHVIPQNRYSEQHGCLIYKGRKFKEYGVDDIRNLLPVCRSCNIQKATFLLEDFRHEISQQIIRARKTSANFRIAERFCMVEVIEKEIVFYFERKQHGQ